MKFAHLADCHLGAWRQSELNNLNFQSFQRAIEICLKEKVEFVLIAGDLFDSAYPSITTLKETFREFRKLKEASIPVFLIAGSHDYSVSGKSFLDVLEKAGFCRNVSKFQKKGDNIILEPTLYGSCAIYGYPGKKSGMEVDEIERAMIQDSPGLFRILMLHTTLRCAVPNPNVKTVDDTKFPNVDYFALGHLHMHFRKDNKVYPGPIFPNNLPELEELKFGSFVIFDNGSINKHEIQLKPVLTVNHLTNNTINAAEEIIELLEKEILKDKIVIIKVSGVLEIGKISDLDFKKIENYCNEKKAYILLRNTSKLHVPGADLKLDSINTEYIESELIKKFEESNENKFNYLIPHLIKSLQMEKEEEERSVTFEERLLSETKKLIQI